MSDYIDTLKRKVEQCEKKINEQRELKEEFLGEIKTIMIKDNGIFTGDEFSIKGTKVYVCDIKLYGFLELRYKTKKIKTNGEWGNSWDNSYGYTYEFLQANKED